MDITNAAVKFCYKDMRPFVAIEGKGLNNLLEAVSTLSSKYGKLTAEEIQEILPVANTVSPFFFSIQYQTLHLL